MIPKAISRAWHAFLSGERNAYQAIYEYYHAILTAYCLGRLNDNKLAELAVSEVMMKLLNHPQPREIEHLEHWLFVVARNCCNASYAHQQKRQDVLKRARENKGRQKPKEASLRVDADLLNQFIKETLSETDYAIWAMHQDGYKHDEIAGALKVSENTVVSRKLAARKALREAFKKYSRS